MRRQEEEVFAEESEDPGAISKARTDGKKYAMAWRKTKTRRRWQKWTWNERKIRSVG